MISHVHHKAPHREVKENLRVAGGLVAAWVPGDIIWNVLMEHGILSNIYIYINTVYNYIYGIYIIYIIHINII